MKKTTFEVTKIYQINRQTKKYMLVTKMNKLKRNHHKPKKEDHIHVYPKKGP